MTKSEAKGFKEERANRSVRGSRLALREFKAVFFDLDGTLVDIHGPLYIAARNAMREIGQEPELTRERYSEAIRSNDQFLGIPEESRPHFTKLAFAYFMAEVDATERLEVLPHVPEILAELKRRKYITGVITSRPGDSRKLVEKLAMVGLAAHLDHVVTQPTGGMKEMLDKTHTLRRTAERAGAHPDVCVYVGDEPRDIMAATQAGFGAAIAVATGAAPYSRLAGHSEFRPDYVMRSMAELFEVIEGLRATPR